MRLAIFDFDGTILSGNSWHEFFRYELRRRPNRAPLLIGGLVLRRTRAWSGPRLRELALLGLRGCTVGEVAAIGAQIHQKRTTAMVRPQAHEELLRYRKLGYTIVIATGTFTFLVEPFAQECNVDHVISSEVEFENGLCTGKRSGPELLGIEKANALHRRFRDQSVDWDASCAFTDSVIDNPLLGMVGVRYLVSSNTPAPGPLPEGTTVVRWQDRSR